MKKLREKAICEQATGVRGAGDFRAVFEAKGYPHLEILNWTSSAGDWEFLISKDGEIWHIAGQTNRWPRSGFEYWIDDEIFEGTSSEVLEFVSNMWM